MELIIGRDASTSQLRITMGQQSKTFGSAGCVPMTVSRQHCSLTINPDGSYRITNLKPFCQWSGNNGKDYHGKG